MSAARVVSRGLRVTPVSRNSMAASEIWKSAPLISFTARDRRKRDQPRPVLAMRNASPKVKARSPLPLPPLRRRYPTIIAGRSGLRVHPVGAGILPPARSAHTFLLFLRRSRQRTPRFRRHGVRRLGKFSDYLEHRRIGADTPAFGLVLFHLAIQRLIHGVGLA